MAISGELLLVFNIPRIIYSLAQPDSYTGGREPGKVPYIELSQRLV